MEKTGWVATKIFKVENATYKTALKVSVYFWLMAIVVAIIIGILFAIIKLEFLSNIIGVDLILHVLRCFEDSNITHVHDKLDHIDDFEIILSELALKDLEAIEKREFKINTLLKNKQLKDLDKEKELIKEIILNYLDKIFGNLFQVIEKCI